MSPWTDRRRSTRVGALPFLRELHECGCVPEGPERVLSACGSRKPPLRRAPESPIPREREAGRPEDECEQAKGLGLPWEVTRTPVGAAQLALTSEMEGWYEVTHASRSGATLMGFQFMETRADTGAGQGLIVGPVEFSLDMLKEVVMGGCPWSKRHPRQSGVRTRARPWSQGRPTGPAFLPTERSRPFVSCRLVAADGCRQSSARSASTSTMRDSASSSPTLVAMVESTHLRERDDHAVLGVLHFPANGLRSPRAGTSMSSAGSGF